MRGFLRNASNRVLAGALAGLLLACGCGDDGEGGGPGPGPGPNPVLELPVDETRTLSGLGGTTHVAYDSLGIPHIYGPDLRSVLFMQGYQTASDRFWQMDAFRRLAEGRLSELLGELTLATDIEQRTLFTTRDGRRLEEALWEHVQAEAPESAANLQAYADGVNAWLADLRAGRNGATLPPEYQFVVLSLTAEELDEWRPQDTLAIARLQAYQLSETMSNDIALAERRAALSDAVFRDIFRSAPATDATVLPEAGVDSDASGGALARASLPDLPPLDVLRDVNAMFERLAEINPLSSPDEPAGSNNWIVSPEMSASGHAMLANDPHLQHFNPSIWHILQLDAEVGPRANGTTFPGIPGILLGHNDFGAWGGTVANFDVTDVWVEEVTTPPDYPDSPRTVLFNGEQVPVLRIEEPIRLRGGSIVTTVIEVVPHHGPMVPDPDLDDDVEGLAATGMSFRWTGHEMSLDIVFLERLVRARNVEDFRDAVRFFAVGAQNWVWADVNGDIAYFPHVLIPQRPPGAIPWLPMDGTGGAEWLTDESGNTLWLPEERIPQATNPPAGYLATSNNDQLGNTLDNDPLNDDVYLTFSADLGFRQQRILDLLSNRAGTRPEGAPIRMADMAAYQLDTVSLEASRLVPFLMEAADMRPDLVTPAMQDAIDRLNEWGQSKGGSPAWNMTTGVDPGDLRDDVPPRGSPVTAEEQADAVASSIYAAWSTRLYRALLADDFAGLGFGPPGGDDATKALLHLLEDIERDDPGFVVHTRGPDGQSTLWDDRSTEPVETRDEIILGALADALPFLEEAFGSAVPQDWLWGLIHQVRLQHFFGLAGIPSFDLGNFPVPGGRETVSPAGYSLNSDRFVTGAGPSKRFVIVLDPAGVRAVNSLPGGVNGNPGGVGPQFYNRIQPERHYADLLPGWLHGEHFAYRIARQDVADDTQRLIRFEPAGE